MGEGFKAVFVAFLLRPGVKFFRKNPDPRHHWSGPAVEIPGGEKRRRLYLRSGSGLDYRGLSLRSPFKDHIGLSW